MNILITYSSGYGSTREVAETIAEILRTEEQFKVQVMTVDHVESLSSHDAVIIGCSVRADKPLANIRDFFARFRNELSQKKIALFVVCLSANSKEGREKVKRDYLPPFLEKYPNIEPINMEAFGGKIDFDRLNPVMKSLMKKVLEKTGLPATGSIDTRDWAFIASWAESVKSQLKEN
jgi:menaquinone-dependent protoporphyrinogen oxidase